MPGIAGPDPILPKGFKAGGSRKGAPLFLMGLVVCLMVNCSSTWGEAYDASYWLEKGDAFFAEDSYELALSSYDQAIETDPESFAAWSGKGQSLFQMGLFEEANNAFDRALEIYLASSEAWKDKGKALSELSRYNEAYEAQRKALDIDSENAEAWYEQGRALDLMGRGYGSIEAYSKALKIDPGNADAWYRKGEALLILGRYNESIQALDRALEIDPFNAGAWSAKGWALQSLGEYNSSEKALAKSLEIDLMDADAWTVKGDALNGLGLEEESDFAYNEALGIYDKITDRNSENADAWRRKGQVHYKLGEYGRAKDAFERAMIMYNDRSKSILNEDLWYNEAEIWSDLYKLESQGYGSYFYDFTDAYERALDIYDVSLSADPYNALVKYKKGNILNKLYLNFGDLSEWYENSSNYIITIGGHRYNRTEMRLAAIAAYSEALEIYDKELKRDPRNSTLWLSKGEVLNQLGRYSESEAAYGEALEIYNDVLKTDPNNITALYNSGNVLNKLNRYYESNKVYTEALKLREQAVFKQIEKKASIDILGGSNTSYYWIQKGDGYFSLGNTELALKCYEKAIDLDPNSALAWNNKGRVLYDIDEREEAIEFFDQAIKIDPLYAEAWRNRGEALHHLGNDDEALESYRRANEIDHSIEIPLGLELITSNSSEGKDAATLIAFVIIYLIIILIYINILKIKNFPKKNLILERIQKYIVVRNFYVPLRTFKFFEFLLLLTIPCSSLLYLGQPSAIYFQYNPIYESLFYALFVSETVMVGAIITFFFWILFSPPLIPCGYRAIWADFELQSKKKRIFDRLNYTAIIYFFISGIVAAIREIKNNNDLVFAILVSWILVASLLTILPSVMGIMLCMNLDRQTAKSVFISQFGLLGVSGFWLSLMLYALAYSYPSLKEWTRDFNNLFILMLIPFYILFLLIPYLQGLRRAERQKERLYAARQSLLERLSSILEVPAPGLYLTKLEQFLKDLEKDRAAFIDGDEMVKLGLSWDENKESQEKPQSWGDFKLQIMCQAYHKSRHLDPRFLHIDFLDDLEAHAKECMEQLNLISQKDDSERVAAAYGYAKAYQSKRDEIAETIEMERKTKPRWTVAIATIITLILTPILNELGKLISGLIQSGALKP